MTRYSPQQFVSSTMPVWRVLFGLLLTLALPWLMSAKGTEWQTYLADTFEETTVFPTGQFGEAFYTVDGGQYIIDGRQASQDSLSALTDNLYYYNVEADCDVSESTAGELAFTGLVFHYKTTLQKLRSYYVFYVYPDGYYGAKRVIGEEVTIVLPLARSTEINTAGVNRLAVDAQGTRFDLYINGKYVNGFTDVRIDGGGFGFYVSKQTAGSFDNFRVRVEARDMGQEEPLQAEIDTKSGGTVRGRGRFSIPRDPDRPTYPWEVGAGKSGKQRQRDRDDHDDDQGAGREGRVSQPDELEDDAPVVPPDEQVVIPPAPKKRETKPAPPPDPEDEPDAEPERETEVVPVPTPDEEPEPDDDGAEDTYVTPGGLGMKDEPSRAASSDSRYYGDGFDKAGTPRKAEQRQQEGEEQLDTDKVARPPKSMIALDPPVPAATEYDEDEAQVDDRDREEQERRDREAAKAQRELEEQAQEEQERREREAERERRRLQEEAAKAAEREEAERNDSEAVGGQREVSASNADEDDEGRNNRERLLTSMRSRDWGDEESDTTYIPPRKPREAASEERRQSTTSADPEAVDQRETEPDTIRDEAVPAAEPQRSKRTRDLNVNLGMDEYADQTPAEEHEGTTSVHRTGRASEQSVAHKTGSKGEREQLDAEKRPDPAPARTTSESGELPLDSDREKQSVDVPQVNSGDHGEGAEDTGDTVLLDSVPLRTPDEAEEVREQSDIEKPAPLTREAPRGELLLGSEQPIEAEDSFARPAVEKESRPADAPLPVTEPELGELPLPSPPAGTDSAKPVVALDNKTIKTGFFQLKDDFSQQRWPVSDSAGSSYRYFGAAYEIDNLQSQTMAISFQEERMGDMSVGVGSDFLDGAAYVGYGLASRFSNGKQGINYYGLFVSQTGEALLLRVLNGEETVLVDWTPAPSFRASQRNVLKLEAAGGAVKGYVNGQLIVQCSDNALPPGGYALLAGPGVKVRFDDLDLSGVRQ